MALMDFFCQPGNSDLITNQPTYPNGVADLAKKWVKAAAYVNKVGGAQKTGEQWREV